MYLSADWVALLIFAGPFFVLAFLLLARQSYENPVTLTTVLCLCASTMTGQALLNMTMDVGESLLGLNGNKSLRSRRHLLPTSLAHSRGNYASLIFHKTVVASENRTRAPYLRVAQAFSVFNSFLEMFVHPRVFSSSFDRADDSRYQSSKKLSFSFQPRSGYSFRTLIFLRNHRAPRATYFKSQ